MGTSFKEVYCLNQVIKSDPRIEKLSEPEYYFICYKYLQYAMSIFRYDCKKKLDDNIPYSKITYWFTGNGKDNVFMLDENVVSPDNFYIYKRLSGSEKDIVITDYTYSVETNTITIEDIPEANSTITITNYVIGEFTDTLDITEKTILAEAMNIPFTEEQLYNLKLMNFTVYGGSIKIHSQAEHIKVLNESLSQIRNKIDGLISNYSYRSDDHDLLGLGGAYNAYTQFYKKK